MDPGPSGKVSMWGGGREHGKTDGRTGDESLTEPLLCK